MAEVRRRAGREGRAALRARHRQGDAGGRGRRVRRPAEDRRRGGRGRGRQDDRGDRRAGRGGRGRGERRRAAAERRCGPAEHAPSRSVAARSPGRGDRPTRVASDGGRIKASPLARRIARERGIDLARSSGTGPDGRIVAEDVERAADGAPAPAVVPQSRHRRGRSRRDSCRASARRSRAGSRRRGRRPSSSSSSRPT